MGTFTNDPNDVRSVRYVSQTNMDDGSRPSSERCLTSAAADQLYVRLTDYQQTIIEQNRKILDLTARIEALESS